MFSLPHIYVALEKKAESSSKGTDYAEVEKQIMTVKVSDDLSWDKSQIGKREVQHQGSFLHYQGRVTWKENRVIYEWDRWIKPSFDDEQKQTY